MKPYLENRKGVILIVCYLVFVVFLILGSAFLIRSAAEKMAAEKERDSLRAFAIAEAGLQRAISDLKADFIYSSPI